MATKPLNISAFIEKLLDSPVDQIALIDERHEQGGAQWQRNWFLAAAAVHRRDAQHYERLHNSFFGDNSMRDCARLKKEAEEAVEALILTPASQRHKISIKRGYANKVRRNNWPEHWKAALAEDEAYFARRTAKRKAAKQTRSCQ